MTREEREVWEGLDDDERLDAYSNALADFREMEGRYKAVRSQLDAMISDHSDQVRGTAATHPHTDARPSHVRRAEDAAWRANEQHERARI